MAPSYRGLVHSVLSRVTWVRIPLGLPIETLNLDNDDFKPSVAEMAIRSSLRDCRPRGLRVRLSPDGPISNGCIEIKSMVYRLQLEQLFLCGFEPRMHPPISMEGWLSQVKSISVLTRRGSNIPRGFEALTFRHFLERCSNSYGASFENWWG